jgi:UDP-N-acetylmuramate: L-alanyl-gamma-D-glutamyl-meso-diaminopimelate ligase
MKIHLIAIGGSAMHNIALAMHKNGHIVTGSDDEIYSPAKERLALQNLLPQNQGWFTEKITNDLDLIILGMHARKDNPELLKAQTLGLKIMSYPEFVFHESKDKKRIVIGGSHGKTTITSMILHILKSLDIKFDYLVGSIIEGFDNMVQLTDAPLIVIEGDEYLSSPMDMRSKFLHYHPHIAVITGIAWDHINVFKTFESYVDTFEQFIATIEPNGKLYYYENDNELQIIKDVNPNIDVIAYDAFEAAIENGNTTVRYEGNEYGINIFGKHNLTNLRAAYLVCKDLGISVSDFFYSIQNFKGAAKRLQLIKDTEKQKIWLDFAHAPSKVRATVSATKKQYQERDLLAVLELHTFSSLNPEFLPQYKDALIAADIKVVFFSQHALQMKKMKTLQKSDIQTFFNDNTIFVFDKKEELHHFLVNQNRPNLNILLMTSGNFEGMDLKFGL